MDPLVKRLDRGLLFPVVGVAFHVDPITLLIKPLIAAGLFLTKLFVAAGYVATQGTDPASLQQGPSEAVRVAVVADTKLRSMEMELPNGELFELADAEPGPTSVPALAAAVQATDPAPAPARRLGRPITHTQEPDSRVVAVLESTMGRTMQCDVTLSSSAGSQGSAHCSVAPGERYDVTF